MARRQDSDAAGRSARALVVMGVSGSGKSTVGARLAAELGWEFLDADGMHPPRNVALMASGRPLTDADRAPWLAELSSALARRLDAGRGVVLACSALRRAFRDGLRSARPGVAFLYLRADRVGARSRVAARGDHFFPAALVDSQFEALEEPDPAQERDVVVVDASMPLGAYTREWAVGVLDRLAGQ